MKANKFQNFYNQGISKKLLGACVGGDKVRYKYCSGGDYLEGYVVDRDERLISEDFKLEDLTLVFRTNGDTKGGIYFVPDDMEVEILSKGSANNG